MLLLPVFQPKISNCVLFLLLLTCIGNAKTEKNDTAKLATDGKMPTILLEQKSVKKELKDNIVDEAIIEITPPNGKDVHHIEKMTVIDEKSITESSREALNQQTTQKGSRKNILETSGTTVSSQHHQNLHHVDDDFILEDEDISESLKAGFYFFLILSSGAIVFIIYKIYRLRLSRAERKYGVQGDRSIQELTPLPVSIEDGHSDDEDQTVFDIQHQNRIL